MSLHAVFAETGSDRWYGIMSPSFLCPCKTPPRNTSGIICFLIEVGESNLRIKNPVDQVPSRPGSYQAQNWKASSHKRMLQGLGLRDQRRFTSPWRVARTPYHHHHHDGHHQWMSMVVRGRRYLLLASTMESSLKSDRAAT